jgi:(S)-2-hydroxyglutarate dehydrogenase
MNSRPAFGGMGACVRYDFCVVGGGIVGLATAREILRRRPGAALVLLEKEADLAAHQTGHNSGVIHAGVYYAPGSLKARLCRAGNLQTKQFCAEHGIPIENCGKLIVATTPVEVQRLADLRKRCNLNEIATHEVAGTELSALEPRITGLAALLVPSTGIVDYRRVSRALADDIQKQGGEVRLHSCVHSISEGSGEVDVVMGQGEPIRAGRLIACGGLQADRLARGAGLDVRLRIIPFRGEYFQLPIERSQIVRHLIYPVPDPELPFLGVHLTRMMSGRVTVGPNAVLGFAREGYPHFSFNWRDTADTLSFPGFWRVLRKHWRSALGELHGSAMRSRYLQQCRKYCPELTLKDLEPYPAGIRSQAVLADGTLVHDFLFADTPRTVHVLNAPSPAATAALPIARVIAARVLHEAEC